LRWCLCAVTLLGMGSWAWAVEPPAKSAEPAAKAEEPAAKGVEPAAKSEAAAPKSAEPAAKSAEPAAKKTGEPATPPPAASPPAAPPPATHTVKKGPFKITLELSGSFEAEKAHEIFVKPEEWTSLIVDSAVAHGARVNKGEVLLSLNPEKLDRVIADLRTDLKLSDLSIQQVEDQLQALEKTTPLDLEASERAARTAEEDRKSFFDVDRPFTLKAIEFSLKITRDALEYEEEELRQLEKMYKADDITEETEEIVLKRARDTVEKAKFMVEYAQVNHDRVLKFLLPRAEDTVKESASRKSLDWEKNKVQLPLAVQKQQLELEKLRVQRERTDERLKKLLGDRELLTVKSPADGIVYYGKCVRGRFSDSTSLADSLRRNGAIMPNQVVMTVVQPRPMFIRAAAAEDQLHDLPPNLKGVATPTGYPDLKLSATIDDVGDVPTAPGSFDARLSVSLDRKAKRLMPGMTCKVKLVPYLKKDALTVPPKTVSTDELDDQKQFVYVLDKDGKPQKRDVEVGKKTDKQVEILTGLTEGDKVLLEAPKDQK
jgi:HlyD family secretion protein